MLLRTVETAFARYQAPLPLPDDPMALITTRIDGAAPTMAPIDATGKAEVDLATRPRCLGVHVGSRVSGPLRTAGAVLRGQIGRARRARAPRAEAGGAADPVRDLRRHGGQRPRASARDDRRRRAADPRGLGQVLKANALGRDWIEKFPGSRGLRDADRKVPIDILLTGGIPGDGTPHGVAFPDPVAAAIEHEGVRYLSLQRLVELKLASGLSAPDRLQDLADVIQLIRHNRLGEHFADALHPYVQPK